MEWNFIKKSIQEDLLSRGLKNPNIRLNALNRIEALIKNNYQKFLTNPQIEFNAISKNEFKERLSAYKENGRLSGAENSIINEIYKRI